MKLSSVSNYRQYAATVCGLASFVLISVMGCGSANQEPAKAAPKSVETSKADPAAKEAASTGKCSKANRTGTYHVQLQGISSSCPTVPDFDVEWNKGDATLEPGCTLDKPDKWSTDGCNVQHLVTCTADRGASTKTIMVSSPESDDGSIYAGVVSIKKLDASGKETCQGTFRFIAAKS